MSWMLAGVLQGWAAPGILEAFEAGRWPITEQVSHYAMSTAMKMARARADVPANIEVPGPEGDAVRERFGRAMYQLHVAQFCWTGCGRSSDRRSAECRSGVGPPKYIRAPSLTKHLQAKPAWSTQSLNPRRSANMFAVDGRETWLTQLPATR